MERLTPIQYEAQIRDISKQYDMIRENPSLSESRLGDMARARLSSLDSRVAPSGPNVPLVNGLEGLVR